MEINKDIAGKNHIKISVKLTSAEWNSILDKASGKVGEGLKIDGFREGGSYSFL